MKSSMLNMVLSLTIIACIMGAILAWVHQVTIEPIAASKAKAQQEALASVLPPFDNNPTEEAKSINVEGENRDVKVYPAKLNGEKVGVAVETWTMDGFSGEITLMVGFDNAGTLTGYKVLKHAETPGLGAKADDWFRDSVGNRSIIGTSHALAVDKDGGEIDGITAATITSRAILDAVNRARKAINKVNE